MTKNQIFRQFHCNLSVEDAAELCFRSVMTVKRWDRGENIPDVCKRLMRIYSKRQIDVKDGWEDMYLEQGRLVLPSGKRLSSSQVILASALLEISCEQDRRTIATLIKLARSLSRIQKNYV
ncbi:regulator [Vibrio tubiashii]|uniref:regulator n=1 Tax=Vibrio tubiashii TaxID=29498 RepID=UPI00349EC026